MDQEMGLITASLPYARSEIQDILSVKLAMLYLEKVLPYLNVRNSGELDERLQCDAGLVQNYRLDINVLVHLTSRVAEKVRRLLPTMQCLFSVEYDSYIRCVISRESVKVVGVERIEIKLEVLVGPDHISRSLFLKVGVFSQLNDVSILIKSVPDKHLDKRAVSGPDRAPSTR